MLLTISARSLSVMDSDHLQLQKQRYEKAQMLLRMKEPGLNTELDHLEFLQIALQFQEKTSGKLRRVENLKKRCCMFTFHANICNVR